MIKNAGNLSYMELAMAAKAHIILKREGGEANRNRIKSVAKNLGWSMNGTKLDKAIDFLEKVHLARWKNID